MVLNLDLIIYKVKFLFYYKELNGVNFNSCCLLAMDSVAVSIASGSKLVSIY